MRRRSRPRNHVSREAGRGSEPPLRERALLRDAGATGKTRRRRPGLSHDEKPRRRVREPARKPLSNPPHARGVGGRPDPQHDRASRPHERQAPLGAIGGWASAFATATPAQSSSCSSARPQTTRAFGGAQSSRNAHFRRSASSSTPRGPATRGPAGCPAHLPPNRRRRSGRRNADDRLDSGQRVVEQRLARAARSSSAVRPGVATTARSQASSGEDDDVAIRLLPLAQGRHACDVLQPLVTTFRSIAVIGSSAIRSPRTARSAARQRSPRASRAGGRGSRRRRSSPAKRPRGGESR